MTNPKWLFAIAALTVGIEIGAIHQSGAAVAQAYPAKVVFSSGSSSPGLITGYYFEPGTPPPHAAIVALHGCDGIFDRNGALSKRHADWAIRWVAQGYAVLFPDSFGSRGTRSICQQSERSITPQVRAGDVRAAAAYLTTLPTIDKTRVALVGWSNGGSTVLRVLGRHGASGELKFKTAIAFYPGCRPLLVQTNWVPTVPLTVLIGSADNWTPAEPCRILAERAAFRIIEYDGAVHGFDAPDTKRRTRTGLGYTGDGSGRADVGTDVAGRAAAIAEVNQILGQALGR